LGLGLEWQRAHGYYFPVRSAYIEYLKPARIHQWVEVVSTISEQRKASIIYDQYLRLKERPDTILCKAEVKVACVDTYLKPQPLPKQFIELVNGEPM
jgi:acyl-CoA thioester hydrolase